MSDWLILKYVWLPDLFSFCLRNICTKFEIETKSKSSVFEGKSQPDNFLDMVQGGSSKHQEFRGTS